MEHMLFSGLVGAVIGGYLSYRASKAIEAWKFQVRGKRILNLLVWELEIVKSNVELALVHPEGFMRYNHLRTLTLNYITDKHFFLELSEHTLEVMHTTYRQFVHLDKAIELCILAHGTEQSLEERVRRANDVLRIGTETIEAIDRALPVARRELGRDSRMCCFCGASR